MKLLYAEDEAAMSEAVVDMELYLGESKWSRNIKEQTRRLSGLMQDLLTLARMDEGAAPAQKAAPSPPTRPSWSSCSPCCWTTP